MYNKAEVVIFRTNVQTITGTKEYTDADNIINIEEFHKCLKDGGKFVVLVNDVSKWNQTVSEITYVVSNKVPAPEGYEDSYVFSSYGRSNSAVTNRKIKMSFKKVNGVNTLQAVAYTS